MTTSLQTTPVPVPPTIDAATLRRWADQLGECLTCCPVYFQIMRPLLTGLRAEVATYATVAERSEAEYAAYCDRQQPRVDHEFGCVCSDCTATIVLTEAARTGEACGIVRRIKP